MLTRNAVPGTRNNRANKSITGVISVVKSSKRLQSANPSRRNTSCRLAPALWSSQGPQHRQPANSLLAHHSYSVDPVPTDLRIEAKEEDGTSDIEYDEENKVVRIPLSALGPESQRRSKLVLFTCNKCGGRTARLVNPIAWEKGAVFGQCSKCGVWHVLSAPNKKIFEEVRYNMGDDAVEDGQPAAAKTKAKDSHVQAKDKA